jgi:hypothetical protein
MSLTVITRMLISNLARLCMNVHAKWENEAIRQLLINTVSATLSKYPFILPQLHD